MRLRQPRRHGARLDLILTEDASVLVVVPFLHASPIVLRIMPYRPRMTIRADGVQSGDAGRTEENQTLLLIYPRVLMLLCVIWGLFGARGDGTSDNSAQDAAGPHSVHDTEEQRAAKTSVMETGLQHDPSLEAVAAQTSRVPPPPLPKLSQTSKRGGGPI